MIILSIILVLVCLLLVLVVLIQNSKGGGIQSQFGAATQIMGVKRGTEVVEKLTWGLAIGLFIISLLMAPKGGGALSGAEEGASSRVKERAQSAVGLPQQAQPQQQQMQQEQPMQQAVEPGHEGHNHAPGEGH